MKEELRSRYSFHKIDADGVTKMKNIRRYVKNLAEAIDMLCPDGRSKATALTHLDAVMTSANAAIALTYPIDPDDI
jgi:hypothetical protein